MQVLSPQYVNIFGTGFESNLNVNGPPTFFYAIGGRFNMHPIKKVKV